MAELPAHRRVTTGTRLRRQGWTPSAIRAQLAARRWQRCGHAIVLHNGPLSPEERWQVARVHGGPGALLTAFTALQAAGLRNWEREVVHVLVRARGSVSERSPVALRVHRTRDWDSVRRLRDAPVHLPAQALLVAAASFDQPRPACGIVAAAVQQRLVAPATVSAAVGAAPKMRHRRVVMAALADIAQGADALSEIDFVRLCRRFGLPAPIQQAVRQGPDGRRRYLDASWRRADGRLVAVEIDGALHLDQSRWWSDQQRHNELASADVILLRFPSVVIRTQPEVVAEQLRRALRI